MKKYFFALMLCAAFFAPGCEKDPIKPPIKPEPPKPQAPVISFEGTPSKEIEYGQGVTIIAKTDRGTITFKGDTTKNPGPTTKLRLEEMIKDTTLTFTATSPEGLKAEKSVNIKVGKPDPFHLKMIGVWKFEYGEIFDYESAMTKDSVLSWRRVVIENECMLNRIYIFTIRKETFEIGRCMFPVRGYGYSWFIITPHENGMHHFQHSGSAGNESLGHTVYYFFKGDTLVWHQTVEQWAFDQGFRTGRMHLTKVSDDYKSIIDTLENVDLVRKQNPRPISAMARVNELQSWQLNQERFTLKNK